MALLVARNSAALAQAIARSCQDKATIVADDEREQGVRALLNLGHTFGHAIETGSGYGNCLHGEAIAIGMVMAADLSQRMGWLSEDKVNRIRDIMTAANLPITVPGQLSSADFMELMAVDKKVQDGQIRLVLLHDIGEAIISDDYDSHALATTLAKFTVGN